MCLEKHKLEETKKGYKYDESTVGDEVDGIHSNNKNFNTCVPRMVMKLHSLAEASCVCSFRENNLPRWPIERKPLIQICAHYCKKLMLNACTISTNVSTVCEKDKVDHERDDEKRRCG